MSHDEFQKGPSFGIKLMENKCSIRARGRALGSPEDGHLRGTS